MRVNCTVVHLKAWTQPWLLCDPAGEVRLESCGHEDPAVDCSDQKLFCSRLCYWASVSFVCVLGWGAVLCSFVYVCMWGEGGHCPTASGFWLGLLSSCLRNWVVCFVFLCFWCLCDVDGFNKVFPMEKLSSFSHEEVQMILCGNQSPSWAAEDIINYTEPKLGYTRDRYVLLISKE